MPHAPKMKHESTRSVEHFLCQKRERMLTVLIRTRSRAIGFSWSLSMKVSVSPSFGNATSIALITA